ncbi:MAG: Zn-ribbon containing protein [Halobacteriaceae archaeon]
MPHQCTECGHVFPDGSKEMLSGCPECGGNKFQFHADEVPDREPDTDPPEPSEPSGFSSAVGRAADTVRGALGADAADEPAVDAGRSDPSGTDPADPSPDGEVGDTRGETPEDSAQADARSSVVDADALPDPPDDVADPMPDGPSPQPDRSGETAGAGDASPADPAETETADVDDETAAATADHETGSDPPPAEADAPEQGSPTGSRPDLDDPGDGTAVETPDLEALREELNDQFESIRIVAPGQYELNLMELYDREEYIIALQENGRYVIEVPDAWQDQTDGFSDRE